MGQKFNTQKLPFTVQQTRQSVIKSVLNTSTSKSSWTFSRQKRFNEIKFSEKASRNRTELFLEEKSFAPKNHAYGFGKSQRKLWTQVNESPVPGKYNPQGLKNKYKFVSFAEGRQSCVHGSYINPEQIKVPPPTRYHVKSAQKPVQYTMRPKTCHQRTYFIQNKEAELIPGPGKYDQPFQKSLSKTVTSKFKDSKLGYSGLMSKSKRFMTQNNDIKAILSTQLYDKLKSTWSKGCLIGGQKRKTFIQKAQQSKQLPGPGNYQLPSQFGHYKKIKSYSVRQIK